MIQRLLKAAGGMLAGALLVLVPLASAHAQAGAAYPNKPIRLVLPFPAGGGGDSAGRLITAAASKYLNNQTFVVDNRTGTNGRIGVEFVIKSAPDGYTLVFSSGGALTIAPHLAKLSYDPFTDLLPITLGVVNDGVILVHPSFPAQNFREWLAEVKRNPGKYSYGTSGSGSTTHLAAEWLKSLAGIDIVHVPYKGDAPAIADLMGGQIPMTMAVLASASQFIKSGRVRAIASMGSARYPEFPDLQTVRENGIAGFQGGAWLGFLAPAGTPADIVNRLNDALRRAINEPEVRQKLVALGSTPAGGTAAEFARFIRDEHANFGKLIRANNIKGE